MFLTFPARMLFYFTGFLWLLSLFLVYAGALVTSHDAGLAVPDWPLSYGQWMPPMVGNIFYEHGHRMVAALVAFLNIFLVILYKRREENPLFKKLAYLSLFLVISQAILGGITVLFLLPVLISTFHSIVAATYVSLLAVLTLFQWQKIKERVREKTREDFFEHQGFRRQLRMLLILVYIQLTLGALMRHTGTGLSLPDFPLVFGGFFPPYGDELTNWVNELRFKIGFRPLSDALAFFFSLFHYFHRMTGFVILGILVGFFFWTPDKRGKQAFFILCSFLVIQILLGILVLLQERPPMLASVHVLLGVLFLNFLWVLYGIRWGKQVLMSNKIYESS